MDRSKLLWLASALFVSACGPQGTITGRVTVEDGEAKGIAVIVYGPQSGATVTATDGAFTFTGLPDGEYVVRATVRDADVEELSATTTITQGKASSEPLLNFVHSNAIVKGKVVFADGSEASNLSVIATGPQSAGARTGTDGSFTFPRLKNGAYVISVEVPNTREGRVGIGVDASGTKDVGELRLTPVGLVEGVVTFGGMPVSGAPVSVPGTGVSAVSDAAGTFRLVNVPTGTQTILTRVGSEPFFRSATAMITVVRGVNTPLTLTMSDDPPKTGTVQGVVTFRGPRNPRDITISVPGTSVTGQPASNGAFTLTVPVGTWDVMAVAPSHPKILLGRVEVREGAVVQLPGAMLSFYRSIWKSDATLTFNLVSGSPSLESHTWNLVNVNDGVAARLALINTLSGEVRFLAIGAFNGAQISLNARYVSWFVGNTVFLYEVATGNLSSFPALANVSRANVSTDETVLFVLRAGATLTRIPLANPTNAVIFPTSGTSTNIQQQGRDRWFVREGVAAPTSDFRLVTTTADVANAFTAVSQFSLTPTAWALTNCSVTCQLKVLAPAAVTTAVTVSGVSPTAASWLSDSRGDYPCFTTGAGVFFCARSSDGTRYPLPNNVGAFRLNEAGTRVIYTYNNGVTLSVREEAMPPSPGTTDLDASASGWSLAWLSPTRAIAMEGGAAAGRRVYSVTNGTAAPVDTDTAATASFVLSPPLMLVPQGTTAKWRAALGDSPMRSIDAPTSLSPSMVSARAFGGGETVTRYASVSFDTVTMNIVDETAGMVRARPEGRCYAGLRSGPMEVCLGYRPGSASDVVFHYQTNTTVELIDGSVSTNVQYIGSQANTLGFITLSRDSRELMLGTLTP